MEEARIDGGGDDMVTVIVGLILVVRMAREAIVQFY